MNWSGTTTCPGSDLLAQAADRADREQAADAELLHAVDVGAEVELAREQAVAAPVARQEGDAARRCSAPDHVLVGRLAERRLETDALDVRRGPRARRARCRR